MYQATGEVAHFRLRVCHLYWSRADITHVCISWDHHPILLLSQQRIYGRSTSSFQFETGAAYDRSKIQMGIRKGATVLLHYRRGLVLYQCVCVMQGCARCLSRQTVSARSAKGNSAYSIMELQNIYNIGDTKLGVLGAGKT